jgi:hypothetical protein
MLDEEFHQFEVPDQALNDISRAQTRWLLREVWARFQGVLGMSHHNSPSHRTKLSPVELMTPLF